MTAYFVDTSAIVKRYLSEVGTSWIRSLHDPADGNIIIVSEITLVEVAAALAARHRAIHGISQRERDDGLALFRKHYTTEYEVVRLSQPILDQAVDLTQRHRLRGYDAVQLASALAGNASTIAFGQTALTFISSDSDLVAAASAEGLSGDNPLHYP